ncbi:DUF2496 domain-containing protein [Vibrio sp. RC27]
MNNTSSELNDAPKHIQLAVDLIYLLEANEVDPKVAIDALKVVEQDLLEKINKLTSLTNNE